MKVIALKDPKPDPKKIDFSEVQFEEIYDCYLSPESATVSLPAVRASLDNLKKTRKRTKESQIKQLLHAVTCLDLTTLSGDDCTSNLQRLCAKANNPISIDILQRLGVKENIRCAAVCVTPAKVKECHSILDRMNSEIKLATVPTGFPLGHVGPSGRIGEINQCLADGADEYDVVIRRDFALSGQWKELFEEVKLFRETVGSNHKLKVILGTGELGSLTNVYKASMICMAAGADFIKTSTGKENVNATYEVGIVMARAIKDFYYETGFKVGLKPAGGIRTPEAIMLWQEMILKELGHSWLKPELFRIGASNVLTNIEKTLAKFAYGTRGSVVVPYV